MTQPLDQHPDDGLRVVHENDTVRIIEPDGKASVTILTAMKDDNNPFRVEYFRSTQEIKDAQGATVARTTDPDMARHICRLLIAHAIWSERKAGSEPAR
jgi:hypothetical protein